MKILRHLHVPPVLTRPLQQDPSLSSSVRCCFQLLIGRKKVIRGWMQKKTHKVHTMHDGLT